MWRSIITSSYYWTPQSSPTFSDAKLASMDVGNRFCGMILMWLLLKSAFIWVSSITFSFTCWFRAIWRLTRTSREFHYCSLNVKINIFYVMQSFFRYAFVILDRLCNPAFFTTVLYCFRWPWKVRKNVCEV